MNILITGGLGYIGSHLASYLTGKNLSIYIIDNLNNSKKNVFSKIKKLNKNIKTFENIDLQNKQKLINYFKHKKVDVVIHLAGLKSVSESFLKSKEYYQNNIIGFTNLLDVMTTYKVNKIIFSSSATVYSEKNYKGLTEEDELYTNSVYGFTKKTIEDIIIMKSKNFNLNFVILRYFNPAGCHKTGLIGEDTIRTPNNLFPYIGQIISGRKKFLKIFGKNYRTKDGTGARDYVHIKDLSEAHIRSIFLLNRKNINEIINIGSAKQTTVLSVIDAFKKYCKFKIKYKYYKNRAGDLDTIFTNNNKAKKVLNWKPKKKLKDIILSAYSYYKNDKNN